MISQLKVDVETIAKPGGRPVGSAGHRAARDYLVSRMKQMGLPPYKGDSVASPYRDNGVAFTNLVGRIPGQDTERGALLIGAHYDTCGSTPGADDNAAAVAIVLAAAQMLKQARCRREIIVAIFDAEEPPYFLGASMGSIRFYHYQRTAPIDCAFILDLVGHDVPMPGLESSVFVTGMEGHSDLVHVMEAGQSTDSLISVPVRNSYVGDMSDHHVFRENRVPYMFFSCGRWQHYHQSTDTPDRLNYQKMESIVKQLVKMVAAADQAPFSANGLNYNSTPAELRLMNRALKPWMQGRGMPELQTRENIDAFVGFMLNSSL